jgi:hypothetical protein
LLMLVATLFRPARQVAELRGRAVFIRQQRVRSELFTGGREYSSTIPKRRQPGLIQIDLL